MASVARIVFHPGAQSQVSFLGSSGTHGALYTNKTFENVP